MSPRGDVPAVGSPSGSLLKQIALTLVPDFPCPHRSASILPRLPILKSTSIWSRSRLVSNGTASGSTSLSAPGPVGCLRYHVASALEAAPCDGWAIRIFAATIGSWRRPQRSLYLPTRPAASRQFLSSLCTAILLFVRLRSLCQCPSAFFLSSKRRFVPLFFSRFCFSVLFLSVPILSVPGRSCLPAISSLGTLTRF